MWGRAPRVARNNRVMDETDPTLAYGQSWYAATMVDAPLRPQLFGDLDVDVCVIGGGLAGLTTAREIARGGWSVVLLEAGRLARDARLADPARPDRQVPTGRPGNGRGARPGCR